MIFRTCEDRIMYVIEAPQGSILVLDADGEGELILFERMTNGTAVERRLPTPVVVRAALRGSCGLNVLEVRRPASHPEVTHPASKN